MSVYSDPALWEQAKAEARKRMGGHSARAMQLAGRLYRAAGGRYLGKPTKAQKSLEQWTDQDWTTKSGKPSRQTGERYLPREVIEGLTPAEYGATTRAKREGTAAGQQFVKQPKRIAAKVARLKGNPTMKKPTPAQLAARARFAEMARSGAFKRKANPATNADEAEFNLEKAVRNQGKKVNRALLKAAIKDAIDAGINVQKIKHPYLDAWDVLQPDGARYSFLIDADGRGMWISHPRTNPAKKTVSQKISQLTREGYPQKQAVAIALSEERAGKVKRNPAPRGFVKADDYTIEVFNPRGMYPYDAVYMKTAGGAGEPTYDLTILKHEVGKWLAAHGSYIVKRYFDKPSEAAAYLEKWYAENRQPAYKTNPRASNPATGTKKSRTKLNPVQYRDIAKDVPPARVQYAVHLADRPSYQAMSYFTKKADALEVAQEVADRTGKQIAVSRVQVHFGPM